MKRGLEYERKLEKRQKPSTIRFLEIRHSKAQNTREYFKKLCRDEGITDITNMTAWHYTSQANRIALANLLSHVPNMRHLTLFYSIPSGPSHMGGIPEGSLLNLRSIVLVTNEVTLVDEASSILPFFWFLATLPHLESLSWMCKHSSNLDRYGMLFKTLASSRSLKKICMQGDSLLSDEVERQFGYFDVPPQLELLALPDLARKTRPWFSRPVLSRGPELPTAQGHSYEYDFQDDVLQLEARLRLKAPDLLVSTQEF